MKKKKRLIILFVAFLIFIIIGSTTFLFLGKKKLQKAEQQLSQLQSDISRNQRTIYVAQKDIVVGERIEEGVNVSMETVYSGMDAGMYIDNTKIGCKALIDIPTGSTIQNNMVAEQEVQKDTRTYEINCVNLTSRQKTHDIVDIRVRFDGLLQGRDYVVLSKKEIRNLNDGTTFDLFMNEDEILTFNSAMVDAAINGGRLYTTKYVQSQLQEEAIPNYPVNAAILDLINTDPNVINVAEHTLNALVRQELEERIKEAKMAKEGIENEQEIIEQQENEIIE